MRLIPLVSHFPIGYFLRLTHWIENMSIDMIDEHVSCTSGTVIVEIIVAVHSVFWSVVDVNGLSDSPFLFASQVQDLFLYPTAPMRIGRYESCQIFYPHFIIGQSEHETKDEITFLKGEDAVIDSDVLLTRQVVVTYGGVSIVGVDLVAGSTGEQTDAYRVHAFEHCAISLSKSGRRCHQQQNRYKDNP